MKKKLCSAIVVLTMSGFFLTAPFTSANAQTFCTPTYTTGCSTGATIDSVILQGDNSTSLDNGSGCSTNGYGDYTSLTPPDLTVGQSYTIKIVTSKPSMFSHNDASAWIDFNNDSIFSMIAADSENIGSQNNGNTFNFTFTVPYFVPTGDYLLRVRIRNGLVIVASPITPCGNISTGEAEDYLVHVINPNTPTVCNPPTGLSAGNISTDSALLSWLGTSPEYRIEYDTAGFTQGNGTLVTSMTNSYHLGGLLPNTTYNFYVRSICNPGTDSSAWSSVYSFTTPCDTPAVNLGQDTSFCQGTTIQLSPGNTAPGNTYSWNNGANDSVLTVDTAGTYSVTVTDQYGCSATDAIQLSENYLPTADSISVTAYGDCSFSFAIVNPQNVTGYDWDFGDGTPHSDQPIATHSFATNGNHNVTLILSNDCGSDTFSTTVNCDGVGIQQIELNKNQLQLYPNPAKDRITLKNNSPYQMQSVVVYNVLGQIVYRENAINAKMYRLDIRRFASGLYNIKIVMSDNSWVMRKFEVRK